MTRVAVILGSIRPAAGGAPYAPAPVLPAADRAAMTLALERFGGSVDAYCSQGDEEAWRYALAAGAASATRLHDVTSIEFDIVLVGSGGAGSQGDRLLAQLAERKQSGMVLEVLDVEMGQGGKMAVTRDLGRGSREILEVSGTAVLGVSENSPRLRYVSRHRRQRVAAPAVSLEAASRRDPKSGVDDAWEPIRPRTRSETAPGRTSGSATNRMQALLGLSDAAGGRTEDEHVIVADAATCARHLLRYLGHHGFIHRAAVDEPTLHELTRRAEDPPARPGQDAREDKRAREPQRRGEGGPRRSRGPRPVDENSDR